MEKTTFKNLLTDLYNIYNPANLEFVDDLVERYSRLEFDAVSNIYLKYNRKSSPIYNEAFGTDDHIFGLIKEYNNGKRTLEGLDLKGKLSEKKVAEEKKIEELKKENLDTIQKTIESEAIQNIQKSLTEKEQEVYNKFENINKEISDKLLQLEKLKNEIDNDVIIKIFSTYTNSEIELPNKKLIAGLGKGSMLVTRDAENKMMGMIVSDVIIDLVSDKDGKPIIEITVEKS